MAPSSRKSEPKQRITLPHVRAYDYREHRVDGVMHRVDGDQVVLTFFQNDYLIASEGLQLKDHGSSASTYSPVSVQETPQRVEVVAVRIPIRELLASAETTKKKFEAAKP